MIRKALEYLVGLKANQTYNIEGEFYSDNPLVRIEEPRYAPTRYSVGSLDALVTLIKREARQVEGCWPIYVRVDSPTSVVVDSSWDGRYERKLLYRAECPDANFDEGWRSHEKTMIELQSSFIPTTDSAYLLDLLSRVSLENGVTTNDNGMSQSVVTKQGVSLKTAETVRNILELKPFRTFREVMQPESLFLVRLSDDGTKVALFEADGGVWKMDAKRRIAGYLEEKLEDEVKQGIVEILPG